MINHVLANDIVPLMAQEVNGGGALGLFVRTLIRSVALGSIYAIMGMGFVLIFKGTQVLNFAMGAIAMSGALFMSILVSDRGFPIWPLSLLTNPLAPEAGTTATILQWLANLVVALIFAALLGLVLERLAIRPMVGQPLFAMAVITLGIEIAMRPFNNDAIAIQGRSLGVPWGNETFTLLGEQIAKSYPAAILCGILAFLAVFFFYRSRLGIAMRAVAFDQEAAMAQGINVGRVFAIAWALGSVLAALAAIFYGMSGWAPNGSVSPEHPILAFRVLPVIILGGLDSVQGAVYGGLIIATFEIFVGEYMSGWTWLGPGFSSIVPYIVMVIVLLVKPYGLFGTEEIRRV